MFDSLSIINFSLSKIGETLTLQQESHYLYTAVNLVSNKKKVAQKEADLELTLLKIKTADPFVSGCLSTERKRLSLFTSHDRDHLQDKYSQL